MRNPGQYWGSGVVADAARHHVHGCQALCTLVGAAEQVTIGAEARRSESRWWLMAMEEVTAGPGCLACRLHGTIQGMDDIAAKIEMRDRVMRRAFLALSMEERAARMRQSHEWKRAQLAAHPAGFDWFIRRNMTKRAINRAPDGIQDDGV